MIIHAKSGRAIILSNQNNRSSQAALAHLCDTTVQHLLDLSLFQILFSDRKSSGWYALGRCSLVSMECVTRSVCPGPLLNMPLYSKTATAYSPHLRTKRSASPFIKGYRYCGRSFASCMSTWVLAWECFPCVPLPTTPVVHMSNNSSSSESHTDSSIFYPEHFSTGNTSPSQAPLYSVR